MKVGYSRLLGPNDSHIYQMSKFSSLEVAEIVIEPLISGEVYPGNSQLMQLLSRCRPGDVLIVPSLERVSKSPVIWQGICKEIISLNMELKVQAFPSVTTNDWVKLVKEWHNVTTNSSSSQSIIAVKKESKAEGQSIRPFTRKTDNRELYWDIFKELQRGASLRRTARRKKVSQGTVLRIKRDLTKLKQVIWLVVVFAITVASLKISQSYSDNWFFQVIICGLATVLIIYLTYSDMKD